MWLIITQLYIFCHSHNFLFELHLIQSWLITHVRHSSVPQYQENGDVLSSHGHPFKGSKPYQTKKPEAQRCILEYDTIDVIFNRQVEINIVLTGYVAEEGQRKNDSILFFPWAKAEECHHEQIKVPPQSICTMCRARKQRANH